MTLPPITVTASHDCHWIACDPISGCSESAITESEALARLHQQMIERGASMVERRIRFIPHRPDGGAVKRFMDRIWGRAG